jgi:phosphatidylserine/phosphatidylglycerophosphate/cardiolipin synthase-like enzyme
VNALGAVTLGQLADAVSRARDIEVSAWTLRSGVLERALEQAGDRGAHVTVHLESRPYSDSKLRARRMHQQNVETAAALGGHGVRVEMRADRRAPLHMKAAVVDGTAYLDERNWGSADAAIVVTDRPADVALVRDAFAGRSGATDSFATRKDAALELEADVIEHAPPGVPIRFASESFGPGPVATALEERARGGEDVRVIVDRLEARESAGARERSELGKLRAAGAQIRVADRPAKECLAGDDAWVGSANATAGNPHTLDWGMRTAEPALLAALAAEFERAWQHARPVE